MNSELSSYHFQPVAVVRSCFKTKFGIPRQPGLISEARGSIELLPPYNQPNAVRGLEDFSHIWVLFVFHDALREGWKATVRPPRLGGDKRVGVFASRSPFRPCPSNSATRQPSRPPLSKNTGWTASGCWPKKSSPPIHDPPTSAKPDASTAFFSTATKWSGRPAQTAPS